MKRVLFIIFGILWISRFSLAQEPYNSCVDAQELCAGETFTASNIGANSTFCPNCEDDFNFCFEGENTIWFKIETKDSGDLTINFSNFEFENLPGQGNAFQTILIEASVPCVSSSYDTISDCITSMNSNTNLFVDSLDSNAVYYLIVNGEMGDSDNAEGTMDLEISGSAVDYNPYIFISTASSDICAGYPTEVIATIENCNASQPIDWFVNSQLVATTASNVLETTELEDGDTLTAQVFCEETCSGLLFSNEIVFSVTEFEVDAGPDFEIFQGESVQLLGSSEESTGEVLWEPPIAMSNPQSFTPSVTPDETTVYYLTVSDGNCTMVDFCVVTVRSDLVIPNTFTPNDDGANDTWEILGIDKYPDCFIQVFDRWGQLVFQTTGYPPSKYWNGTSKNGRPLAPSAYYYVIDLRDAEDTDPIKGHVSIVR
jgi:gliding motility-associated-like protein